jgi:hypothetical protein
MPPASRIGFAVGSVTNVVPINVADRRAASISYISPVDLAPDRKLKVCKSQPSSKASPDSLALTTRTGFAAGTDSTDEGNLLALHPTVKPVALRLEWRHQDGQGKT